MSLLNLRFVVIRLISFTIFIVSVVVMFGWVTNLPYLTNLTTQFIPMKFVTALSFLLASVCLFIMSHPKKDRENFFSLTLLIAASLLIFLFMATIFLSNILKVSTGLENLFVQEASATNLFSAPGQPSLYTILSFSLFSFACLVYISSRSDKKRLIQIISLPIIFISVISVIGFVLDLPVLYSVWPGFSVAIALNTAFLFGLLGLGLLLVGMTI